MNYCPRPEGAAIHFAKHNDVGMIYNAAIYKTSHLSSSINNPPPPPEYTTCSYVHGTYIYIYIYILKNILRIIGEGEGTAVSRGTGEGEGTAVWRGTGEGEGVLRGVEIRRSNSMRTGSLQ